MNLLADLLAAYPVLVLDGALATELEWRGCDLRDPLWSAKVLIEAPALIKQVHRDYFAAGADCATTATYQATFAGFARRGIDEAASADLMRLAVRLAVEARDEFWADPANRGGRPRPFIAASAGSYGAYLADGSEYVGHYDLSEDELRAFHRPRLAVLSAAGADLIACETIPCFAEAQALAGLLAEFPGTQAWISFSARDEAHIASGERLDECLRRLETQEQVVAVGVNCTSPVFIEPLLAAARTATSKPLLVYPNSGETYQAEDQRWSGAPALPSLASWAPTWYAQGARLIGGCCRTTPADIAALAAWVRR